MWDRFLQLLPLGCRHRHLSQPFSPAPAHKKAESSGEWERVSADPSEIYVVCLDCGRHFDYDWSTMRVVK
jgi:hypothetical protein